MAYSPSTSAGTILVVEDNADTREMLVEYLQFEGLTVQAAPDGATALRLVDVLRPRVILMDLAMPGLDGLETTRRLRANANGRAATIVMATGRVCEPDRQAAYRAGCNFFIPKPYNLATLGVLLAGLISAAPHAAGASR
jgi:CheY-like chemotaxis protein